MRPRRPGFSGPPNSRSCGELLLLDHPLQQVDRLDDGDLAVDVAGVEVELGEDRVGAEDLLFARLEQHLRRRRIARRHRQEAEQREPHERDGGRGDELPAAPEEVEKLAQVDRVVLGRDDGRFGSKWYAAMHDGLSPSNSGRYEYARRAARQATPGRRPCA